MRVVDLLNAQSNAASVDILAFTSEDRRFPVFHLSIMNGDTSDKSAHSLPGSSPAFWAETARLKLRKDLSTCERAAAAADICDQAVGTWFMNDAPLESHFRKSSVISGLFSIKFLPIKVVVINPPTKLSIRAKNDVFAKELMST